MVREEIRLQDFKKRLSREEAGDRNVEIVRLLLFSLYSIASFALLWFYLVLPFTVNDLSFLTQRWLLVLPHQLPSSLSCSTRGSYHFLTKTTGSEMLLTQVKMP
jgi:hypothetical protein